jgi:hypothetical protein
MNSNEREAVRTTIVGGRPPGSGRNNMPVPHGIEVLVKKASVDPEFREALLEQRGAAAKAIALTLEPAEEAVLNTIPREQLLGIIGRTVVPVAQRRAFLGQVAVVMLAALGVGIAGCGREPELPQQHISTSYGSQPDRLTAFFPAQVSRGETTIVNRAWIDPIPNTDWPTTTPHQMISLGMQADRPTRRLTDITAPLPTDLPSHSFGIQPDRP